jgi:putative transposase
MLYLPFVFKSAQAFFKSRQELISENALLRYQVCMLKRRRRNPIIRGWDRPILVWLSKLTLNWKQSIFVVQPETIIRWHRMAFKLYWGWKYSQKAGRPAVHPHVVRLIGQMSEANPLWGAPRIHGELLKLGIKIAQSSVEKYMSRRNRPRGQSWKTFLKNHSKDIVAIDFFIVPTIKLKMLWAFVVLSHDRRRIIYTAVTHRPSTNWTIQQLRNAFPFKTMPRFILHDRDRNFWGIGRAGFDEIITGHRCPWQNGLVERVIGSIRRECTDHLIAIDERHLHGILKQYRHYYNHSRTHLSLNKDSPVRRGVKRKGKIIAVPKLGGLHHRYERFAA